MVLILSSPEDITTNKVIDWLRYYKCDYLRISEDDEIQYNNLFLSEIFFDVSFTINSKEYKLSDFQSFWYRRSHFKIFCEKIAGKSRLSKRLNNHFSIEANEIHKLVKSYIEQKSINKYDDIYINKLQALKYALDAKLKVPDTLITNSKKELELFFKKHNGNVITKNYSPGVFIYYKKSVFETFTRMINDDVLNKTPEKFISSMFQENIEKLFEIRVFFLKGSYYASAIFSQNDEKTQIDFRNYNFMKPNRTPPFEINEEYLKKLNKLMKKLNLNSGSIDLLVSKNNEFIFLEVNPIGQFNQVSVPCNYFLEEKVAKQLLKQCK